MMTRQSLFRIFLIFVFSSSFLLLHSPAFTLEKIKIAGPGIGTIYTLQTDLAKALRFFEDEGLDVELIGSKGGTETAVAVLSGSVDFSLVAFSHCIKAAQQGKPLPMVVSTAKQLGMTLLVGEKNRAKIKSVKDLKGLKIGISSPGSGSHTTGMLILKRAGLKPEDVQFISTGIAPMVPALELNKIEAGMFTEPQSSMLTIPGKAFPLIDLFTSEGLKSLTGYEDIQVRGIITRPEMIEKRPDLVQKVVNVIVRVNHWVPSHSSEELANVMPPDYVQDKKIYIAALEHLKESHVPDSLVTPKRVEAHIYYMEEIGELKKGEFKADPATLYDMRFVKKAVEKYPPPK